MRALVFVALAAGLAAPAIRAGPSPVLRGQSNAGDRVWITDREAADLPAPLVDALRKDPYTYFRRVNKSWNERACRAFADERVLRVRLHGDAHLEQYALTRDAEGLDDFDDSAEGPAVIDLVRFIGSLRVAAETRGWASRANGATEQFLTAYRRGLREPAYRAPVPRVVRRLRAQEPPTREAFLASAETRMGPSSPQMLSDAREWLRLVAARTETARPGYFEIKRVGALHLGVGSYTAAKVLMRIEGDSAAADDDVILEAREVSDLRGAACITSPGEGKAVRVLAGSQQIGRLHHEILSVIPRPASGAPAAREWWLRSWDRTYVEVTIADLQSARDLDELAHDAGAQLGSTSLPAPRISRTSPVRLQQLDAMTRLEPRVRSVASELTEDLLADWKRFRATFSASRGTPSSRQSTWPERCSCCGPCAAGSTR